MKYLVEVIGEDKQNHLLIPLTHFSKVLQQQQKHFLFMIKAFASQKYL